MQRIPQNNAAEWHLTSGKPYADPFNQITVDAVFTAPDGSSHRRPAYWAGGQNWGFRYSSAQAGVHRFRTVCSDANNAGLHGIEGSVEVVPYEGSHPLFSHGPLRVAQDHRHLEHADGTPFFWLGDTWWMGLCDRLQWPDDFRELAADRVAKGFTLVQLVAGLYPDMPPFDERGKNEAGLPWQQDWSRINPEYFGAADLRIAAMVRAGLVPCIVGCWGYYLDFAGDEVIRKHWRNIVARWGAYPVVWCLAGEALMFYYLNLPPAGQEEAKRAELRARWQAMAEYVRDLDAHRNPITVHTPAMELGVEQVIDPAVLDVEILQPNHEGYTTLPKMIDLLEKALRHEHKLPVLIGEVNYEGVLDLNHANFQRFQVWTCLLSGAAGHTYGANGIWQMNRRDRPYGPSPYGCAWGGPPWDEAYSLPGSRQTGYAKRLLGRYDWWRFEPHPEWIEPHQTPDDRMAPYAGGIPGKVRVIYFVPPGKAWAAWGNRMFVKALETDRQYRAFYYDPTTGEELDLGPAKLNPDGDYQVPQPTVFHDWVLVLEAVS